MARCGCDSSGNGTCSCAIASTPCFAVEGAGSPGDPIRFSPIIDPTSDIALTCGANGLRASMPLALKRLLDPPRISVTRDQDQLIGNDLNQGIDFNEESFKHEVTHANDPVHGGQGWKVVVEVTGIYDIYAAVRWQFGTAGDRAIRIQKNGSGPDSADGIYIAGDIRSTRSNPDVLQELHCLKRLTAGDWLGLQVFEDSGDNIRVLKSGEISPTLAMVLVTEQIT